DYQEIRLMVENYHGRLHWISSPEFNNKGACISFTPPNELRVGRTLRFVSLKEMFEDGVELCNHLGGRVSTFSIRGVPITPPEMNPDAVDQDDAGIYDIYVLAAPEAGIHGELSDRDRYLHFAPTYDEWKKLMSTIEG